jgi:hypothetical protein
VARGDVLARRHPDQPFEEPVEVERTQPGRLGDGAQIGLVLGVVDQTARTADALGRAHRPVAVGGCTAPARAEAAGLRQGGRREELDILPSRPTGGARRPAVHTGCPHGVEEAAIGVRRSRQDRAPALRIGLPGHSSHALAAHAVIIA